MCMSNSYFEFKQFKIRQDKCAMKVGTDGVLLGAWTEPTGAKRILDIGTGSGLLAIMLAQRSSAIIDAIEINQDAATQARENFESCHWSEQLQIHNVSLQEFANQPGYKYDLIITNPPFFSTGPQSPDTNRAMARHNNSLTVDELILCSVKMLTREGKIALILPVELRRPLVSSIAKCALWIEKETKVIPVPGKPVSRVLLLLSRATGTNAVINEIVVEDNGRHGYSTQFRELTAAYYKFD